MKRLFIKSFIKMKSNTGNIYFQESLKKLGNIIGKLDNKLGLVSSFGMTYSDKSTLITNKDVEKKCEVNIIQEAKEEKKDLKVNENENKEGKIKKEQKKDELKEEKKDDKKAKVEKKEEKPIKKADNFKDIDLRVAKVVKIINMEGSDKLYHCWVDIGEENLREIGCGLRQYGVSMEEFTKLPIVVFANLKPKKLASIMSNGMILSCQDPESKEFELIRPSINSKPGDNVFLEGTEPKDKPSDFLSANKFQKALPLLKTTDDLVASFDGIKLRTVDDLVKVDKFKNAPIS